MHEFERKSVRALEELLPSSNLLLYNGHTMHLLWTFGLSTISAILAALSILSSAIPTTSFSPTEYTANHELTPDVLPGQIHNLPVLPRTQSISKRSALVYTSWGNGWTSRSNTYVALVPVLPAAARLTIFYGRLFLLSNSFPPTMSASIPVVYNGMSGSMVQFQSGGLQMRFFSTNALIPWSFVATVAARLRQNAARGFTGLYGTVFVHETTGLAVFVTLTAAGVPVPRVWPF